MAEMTDSTNISKVHLLYQPEDSTFSQIMPRRMLICLYHGLREGRSVFLAFYPLFPASDNLIQLGPLIGGALARPADRFPGLFGQNEFLKKYPYFLPCAVPATFSVIAWIVTFLFLKETVKSPIPISEFLGFKKQKLEPEVQNTIEQLDPLALSIPDPKNAPSGATPDVEKPLALRSLLTPQVVIAAANYASLALVDIAFRAIQPLFLSTPIHLGGLGLSPPTIGKLLSIYGILNGAAQIFFFAQIHDRYGSKKVFMIGLATALPSFAMFPVINLLARHGGYSVTVWVAVVVQIFISIAVNFSYGAYAAQSYSTCHSCYLLLRLCLYFYYCRIT